MRKLYLIISLLLISVIPVNAATTIDLTDFASGGGDTHSHTWINNYDSDNHWQECQLCKTKQNITEHSLSTRWTIAEGSCSESNYKITSCSCGYYSRVLDRGSEHIFEMLPSKSTDNSPRDANGYMTEYMLTFGCKNCSKASPKYSVTDINGDPIDFSELTSPVDGYIGDTFVRNIAYIYNPTLKVASDHINITYEFIENNTKLKITAVYDCSENIEPNYSIEDYAQNTYYSGWLNNLNQDGEAFMFSVKCKSYDENANTLTFEVIEDISDLEADRSTQIYFDNRIWVAVFQGTFAVRKQHIYHTTYVDMDFFDPVINEANII